MRLWIVSDLHTDHTPWSPSVVPHHDVMVIAGDISNSHETVLSELSRLQSLTGRPVVFVPGNHDLSGGPLDAFEHAGTGPVIVLPAGQAVVIAGVRFVGATLWTDFEIAGDVHASEAWAARCMPEYQRDHT
ncbi:metallophosphoesterase [Devosia sp. SD17-2]|uniref:metallophosphoesterase n=1 Tax=Devosia sp. SD17-2 TaxID=2976459 RepID=UPI0023D805BF|nr:metallophosphoesterase [Devosia sp. SD17-2]WEJ31718.1 metallophosphoesterase family protein [Devosia sp. SD17-2]